jgi:catechol 2,3-dioxygenase-like lactoylglutathione lyase family enzyme
VKVLRRVVVVDAADIDAESAFWAAVLCGEVVRDDDWHSIVVDGDWVMGVQRAPDHVPPVWPEGPQQQQVHLDLHVDDIDAAARIALAHGGRELQAPRRPADNPDGEEMFAVYASPAGHPLCFGSH